ncbi:chitinase [Vibrio astriarenae]|nr:chitinase [Vibrio sp. C7]
MEKILLSTAIGLMCSFGVHANQMVDQDGNNVVVGYWHNWCGGAGYQGGDAPCFDLATIDTRYNVVAVSFMKVYDNRTANSIPTFKLDTSIVSEADFKQQIKLLNDQGRSVILALGGADAHIEMKTGQEQAFADEIILLTEKYGFDGLDIDLEQGAITAADNQTVIPAALRIVKDHYREQGKNFLITMAPEFPYLTTNGHYRPYIDSLDGYYDWINPQFYNQGGDGLWVEELNKWLSQNNDEEKEDFIYYMSDSLANGTRGFGKIPHDKLVFGIPANSDAAATGTSSILKHFTMLLIV